MNLEIMTGTVPNYRPRRRVSTNARNSRGMTFEIAMQIRDDYWDGMKVRDLSKKYNLGLQAIRNIVRNKTWRAE